jgi:nicotinamidase-related amidase
MRFERILMDIEAQRDFFSPGGSCYKPEATAAARNVRRLFAWARRQRIPVLSTVLRNRPGRRGPLAPVPHCVDGSDGEKRISGALLSRHVDLGIRNSTDLPRNIFNQYQQVIFEKRQTDIFKHARAERLLTELEADTFVVCGAGSAGGIAEAVIGLRHRGFDIILAADAILDLDDPLAEMAWLRMLAKKAVPLSTGEIISLPVTKEERAAKLLGRMLRRGNALTR